MSRYCNASADFFQAAGEESVWMNPGTARLDLTARKTMLVANRLELTVRGCNFPAHFLAWITVDGEPHLVDCYSSGRLIPISDLRENSAVLTPDSRRALNAPCTMRDILLRVLRNLHLAFSQQDESAGAELVTELIASLDPAA